MKIYIILISDCIHHFQNFHVHIFPISKKGGVFTGNRPPTLRVGDCALSGMGRKPLTHPSPFHSVCLCLSLSLSLFRDLTEPIVIIIFVLMLCCSSRCYPLTIDLYYTPADLSPIVQFENGSPLSPTPKNIYTSHSTFTECNWKSFWLW